MYPFKTYFAGLSFLIFFKASVALGKGDLCASKEKDHFFSPRSAVGEKQTCPKGQIDSPSAPQHQPWSYIPHCTQPPGHGKYCIYTNSDLFSGQGITIITKPEAAQKFVDDGVFGDARHTSPSAHDRKYEALARPGRGVGLFVKPGEVIRAGELILVDYPTLLVAGEVVDSFPAHVRQDLQWRATIQLPDKGRRRSRGLAKSGGWEIDEIDNVIETNAFRQAHDDVAYLALLPEVAVSRLSLPPKSSDLTFCRE